VEVLSVGEAGTNQDGSKLLLVQHVTNLNIWARKRQGDLTLRKAVSPSREGKGLNIKKTHHAEKAGDLTLRKALPPSREGKGLNIKKTHRAEKARDLTLRKALSPSREGKGT
jgi:hypothetical protein